MPGTALHNRVVDAVLRAADALLGMEVVAVARREMGSFVLDRVRLSAMAGGPPVEEGARLNVADPAARNAAGFVSYVGLPVTSPGGEVLAVLCGLDRRELTPPAPAVAALGELADIVAAQLSGPDDLTIRRTPSGWQVRDAELPELTSAMVLADLLDRDMQAPRRPPHTTPTDELERLRMAVAQLEHALAARVMIEQAIGVLSERLRQSPRTAFERLRRAARSRGRRVHDLAREVVASATDPAVPLPPELFGRN